MNSKKHAQSMVLDSLETRRHAAADLRIEMIRAISPVDPVGNVTSIVIEYTVANRGNTAAGSFHVGAIQTDTPFSNGAEEILNGHRYNSMPAGGTTTIQLTVPIFRSVNDFDDNRGHIQLLADTFNDVGESNESNNSNRGIGVDTIAFRLDRHVSNFPSPTELPTGELLDGVNMANARIGDELSGGRDMDVFTIFGLQGRTYEVDIDTPSNSPLDAVVRVYDGNLNLVAQNDDGGYGSHTYDPFVLFGAQTTGVYYFVVSSKQNANADPRTLQGRVDGLNGDYTIFAGQASFPEISLNAVRTQATEGNTAQPISFVVKRDFAPVTRELFVKWETFGSATLADLALPASGVLIPAGQSQVTITVTPTADGISEDLEFINVNLLGDQRYIRHPVQSILALFVADDPATVRPALSSTRFSFNEIGGTYFDMVFDRTISGLEPADFELRNLDTNTVVTNRGALRVGNNFVGLDFRGLTGKTLPDGNYRLMLRANAIFSQSGVGNSAVNADFFTLAGDANRDRRVNLDDFTILAANFGRTSRTFSQGDFSYDGTVNLDDFTILASKFGRNLLVPASLPLAARTTAEGDSPFSKTSLNDDLQVI